MPQSATTAAHPCDRLPVHRRLSDRRAALRKLASCGGHAGSSGNDQRHTGEVFSSPTSAPGDAHCRRRLRERLPVMRRLLRGFRRRRGAWAHGGRGGGRRRPDVMPPHHWLRFGCTRATHLAYFDAIHGRLRPGPGLPRLSRGLGRHTRQSSWPTSQGWRTCRHSRSGSAT